MDTGWHTCPTTGEILVAAAAAFVAGLVLGVLFR